MKQRRQEIPSLDVIACRALPSHCCPNCGAMGAPPSDGKWPEVTRVSCPLCGWSKRYVKKAEEPANV